MGRSKANTARTIGAPSGGGWFASLASLVAQHSTVLSTKLPAPLVRGPLRQLAAWAVAQQPSPGKTPSHWRAEPGHATSLPAAQRAACEAIASSGALLRMFREHYGAGYEVVPITEMNEMHATTAAQDAGDALLDHDPSGAPLLGTDHVDELLGVFFPPCCARVFRCVIGVTAQGGRRVEAVFPLVNGACRFALSEGDVVGYDVHHEVHRVQRANGSRAPPPLAGEAGQPRVALQLHFAVYRRAAAPLGRALRHLTARFRATLPLANGGPTRRLVAIFQSTVGWSNALYLGVLGGASWLLGSRTLWLLGSCFAHYAHYIATYHARHRALVAFGLFKRDALFYKALALVVACNLFFDRWDTAAPDYGALVLMALGFGLSSAATAALGIDLTYFGWELGAVGGKFVVRWPYGGAIPIPHPMIIGSITAWSGFHKLAAFRADFPWFVPLHVALYVAHAYQEHVAIHRTGELEAVGSGKEAQSRRSAQ